MPLGALSARLEVSRSVGPALLGEATAADIRTHDGMVADTSWIAAARHSVAGQLRTATTRVRLTDESMARLHEAEKLLGVEIIDASIELELSGSDITTVLMPWRARLLFGYGEECRRAGPVARRHRHTSWSVGSAWIRSAIPTPRLGDAARRVRPSELFPIGSSNILCTPRFRLHRIARRSRSG
jgi:hypothetical protein